MATDPIELRLRTVLHDALDGAAGPDPEWSTSPARTRIAEEAAHPARRWPLRLLAVAAILLIGGSVVAGALVQRATTTVAPVSNGWIAFEMGGIGLVAEGAPPRLVTSSDQDGLRRECPVFSSDGRLLSYRESDPETVQGTPKPQPAGAGPSLDPIVGPLQATIVGLQVRANGDVAEVARITPADELDGCPVPSPDGRHVAYGSTLGDIWISTLDGHQTSRAGTRTITGLAWAPDGSALACIYGETELWIVPVDGGEGRHIPIEGNGRTVHWSMDGSRLAVATETGVDILTLDGDRLAEFALPESVAAVAWSPDGRMIATVDAGVISLLTPEGDRVAQLAPDWPPEVRGANPEITSVGWSPDGGRLLLGLGTDLADAPEPVIGRYNSGALVSLPIADPSAVVVLVPPTQEYGVGATSWQAVYR